LVYSHPMDHGQNIHKEPLKVKHSDLKRSNDESAFKSQCPACPDGILLVARRQRTFKLERHDRCVVCGQAVYYLDESVNGETFVEGN
jgi:hypothetical protein